MKLKSIKKKIWSIVIIITTLIGILPVQANTTETPVKDVELDGRWDDPIRSAATNCPITVFTDGYLLTLKNASPDRDMTIRITDMAKGGVVYENDIPEVQSAYITISIANFIIRKSKFPWFPERSVQFSGKRTKRSVQKKRLHTTLIKPEQKVNEDLCSGFIVS